MYQQKSPLFLRGFVPRSIQLPNFLYNQLAKIEEIKYLEF